MFLHPYYTPNEHKCTRKKSEMLLSQQRKFKNTIDTHTKLKFCSQSRHIRAGDFYLCFLCAQARRRTFFITSGEDEVFDILHRLGLAFVVELVEGC